MWLLYLNNMLSSNIETKTLVGRAETKEILEQFLAGERVEKYIDIENNMKPYVSGDRYYPTTWYKVYRKGGLLEWMNPPEDTIFHFESFVDVKTRDDWMQEASDNWNKMIYEVKDLGMVD